MLDFACVLAADQMHTTYYVHYSHILHYYFAAKPTGTATTGDGRVAIAFTSVPSNNALLKSCISFDITDTKSSQSGRCGQ